MELFYSACFTAIPFFHPLSRSIFEAVVLPVYSTLLYWLRPSNKLFTISKETRDGMNDRKTSFSDVVVPSMSKDRELLVLSPTTDKTC